MVFWPLLCLWFSLTRGLPSTAEKCTHIDVAPINNEDWSQAKSIGDTNSLVSLKLTDPSDATSLKELCDGVFEDISVKFNLNKKNDPRLIFAGGNHDDISGLVRALTNQRTRIVYKCISNDKFTCVDLKISNDSISSSKYRIKRNIPANTEGLIMKPHPLYNWVLISIGTVVGVVALLIAVLLCVKSEPSEVRLAQQSGLKIIDGPPPEYLESKQKQNKTAATNIVVTERHNSTDNTMTQEAKMRLDNPSSPSSMSEDRPDSASPLVDVPRPKKTADAPPNSIPSIKEEVGVVGQMGVVGQIGGANDEEEEENPYDIADLDKKDGNAHDDGLNLPPPLPAGGSYAKVSRHSGIITSDQVASYAEIKHHHVGRMRSSTEPIEPLPPLPPPSKSRTLSGSEASHMPLPEPPTNRMRPLELPVNDPMKSLKEEDKVYDSLEDENDEMYESVPEDLREELKGINNSAPLPPRSPKTINGSPSPSRHPKPELLSPDSPTSKKASKKSKKKDDETHKQQKMSILSRLRANSTTGTGRSRKEKRPAEPLLGSPDHTHLTQPIPLPPELTENEDDDNEMYDSVDPAQILEIKARSCTLPIGGASCRTSMLFNPRTAEPLPEVPEDSGSGAKGGGAVMVKRERQIEEDDPNYDIVSRALTGMKKAPSQDDNGDDEDEEDTYDVVKPPEERFHGNMPHPPGHSYAKVSGHSSTDKSTELDDKEYAVVDPNVVLKKRAASLAKKRSEDTSSETEESPYDRINRDSDDDDEESPYDKVKQYGEREEGDSDDSMDDPTYDSINRDSVEPPYDKVERGEEATPPSNPDDPGYASVKKTLNKEQGGVEMGMASGKEGGVSDEEDRVSDKEGGVSDKEGGVDDTVEDDVTYSHIDLAKKYQRRKQKEKETDSSPTGLRSPSPPSIPSPCDLEDILDTPPDLPTTPIERPTTPQLLTPPTIDCDDDPEYDTIGPGSIKQSNTVSDSNSEDVNGIEPESHVDHTPLSIDHTPLTIDHAPLEDGHIYDSLVDTQDTS